MLFSARSAISAARRFLILFFRLTDDPIARSLDFHHASTASDSEPFWF
jgi:hypothetical protein